jgi:hypothetical protein
VLAALIKSRHSASGVFTHVKEDIIENDHPSGEGALYRRVTLNTFASRDTAGSAAAGALELIGE